MIFGRTHETEMEEMARRSENRPIRKLPTPLRIPIPELSHEEGSTLPAR